MSGATPPVPHRSIPSLDGLRALSIVLVLLAHAKWFLPAGLTHLSAFGVIVGNGQHGVAVFFVVSGFLITTLLLKEQQRTGSISLRRFYFRRTLRIFPPYYVFLIAIAVLAMLGKVEITRTGLIAAFTYTWALLPVSGGEVITHCWSLSIEELFYLVWPLSLLLIPARRRIGFVVAGIVLFPVVRVLFYFILPAVRGHEFYMVQGWGDTMLFGCLLAILRSRPRFEAWQTTYLRGWWVALALLIGFYALPVLQEHLPRTEATILVETVTPSVIALASSMMVLYVITRTDGWVGKLLNTPVLKHIGVLSYSLYLWQQLFLLGHGLARGYAGFFFAFACAEISYWVIERPSLALRSRFKI